jgi:polysaccharide export outer membrane protein
MRKLRLAFGILLPLLAMWPLWSHADQAYRLGPNDVVRISVFGQPDLSTVSRLSENGSVTIPFAGEVRLSGMTAREAERKLTQILANKQIVKSPQVAVFVEEFESQKVAVVGQVGKPGMYSLTRGSTLLDLISEAGGLSEDAGDVAIITRKRSTMDNPVTVDLRALLEGATAVPEPKLVDGDRVYVPKMEQFFVYGEVNKPGAYRFEAGMTVMQALSVAGGLTDKATERGMKIHRSKSGVEQVVPAQLTMQIEPNDVIQVKESLF